MSKHDCEMACDEAASALLGEQERINYGKTLLGLIAVKESPKDCLMIATTMTGGKRSLKKELQI